MNIMEEIFEISSCIEISAFDIIIYITQLLYVLQLIQYYKVHLQVKVG